MSPTEVLIAHNGQRLTIDVDIQLASFDDFKTWVEQSCSIPHEYIVVLARGGKNIKTTAGLTCAEDFVCIYDMRILQATSSSTTSVTSDVPLPKKYTPANPPNTLTDSNDLESWQSLLRDRHRWAVRVCEDCRRMADMARARYNETDAMLLALDAAIDNIELVTKPLQQRYAEFKKSVLALQEDYTTLNANWEHYLALASAVPVSPLMVQFMTNKDVPKSRHVALVDLVDRGQSEKAGRTTPAALKSFTNRLADLENTDSKMAQLLADMMRELEIVVSQSTIDHANDAKMLLASEILPRVEQMTSDYHAVAKLTNTSRDRRHAAKVAETQSMVRVPELTDRACQLDDMLRYITERRNTLAAGSFDFMRTISNISTLHSSMKAEMQKITNGTADMEVFDLVRVVQQLPCLYASFVAESIRRKEWSNKMKLDSTTLANEMALFQDEEVKRRRKWQKTVGDSFRPDVFNNSVLGLEVSLHGQVDDWPDVTRDDLQNFLDMLHKLEAEPDVIEDVRKVIEDLNSPTKQQSKRLKAFKSGSAHEIALGRSGLFIRGDNELLQNLQTEKTRMESRLKASESRVRRLESLLHQQSELSRPPLEAMIGSGAPGRVSTPVGSPFKYDEQRKALEELEALNQANNHLESELAAERELTARLHTDIETRDQQHKRELDEANATKKDLLENMEALKREFDLERTSYKDEIRQLQAHIDGAEDDMDQLVASRETERDAYEDKIRELENELEKLRKGAHDDPVKSQNQADTWRDKSRALDTQFQHQRREAEVLNDQLQAEGHRSALLSDALSNLHLRITSGDAGPKDTYELVEVVSSKVADLMGRLKDMQRDMSLLKSDMEHEQSTTRKLKEDALKTQEKHADDEATALRLKDSLAQKTAKVTALEATLAEGSRQLSELRSTISLANGCDDMRQRLELTEARLASMTEDVAARQSQNSIVAQELRASQQRLRETQTELEETRVRLDKRGEHARDLSHRLYSQNDKLCRLLEKLGYAITRRRGVMTVQKIPKSERPVAQSDTSAADPPSSACLRRSSMLLYNSKPLAEEADLELLHWMSGGDAAEEDRMYTTYLEKLGEFDTDLVSETIYKRFKEVEHIARKLQRDVKSYRERMQAFQKEAHEKVAYKNFKEGDLALFLPTRNEATGAWAAFNVGFPHYFLREQESHRLRSREWLLGRISCIQQRVVGFNKSTENDSTRHDSQAPAASEAGHDNPFQLSDGLRWYLIDAIEDKPAAPATPGLAKSTVATNTVPAQGEKFQTSRQSPLLGADASSGKDGKDSGSKDVGVKGFSAAGFLKSAPRAISTSNGGVGISGGIEGVSKALSRSLETRRSSASSRNSNSRGGVGGVGRPMFGGREQTTHGVAGGTTAAGDRNSAVISDAGSAKAHSPAPSQGGFVVEPPPSSSSLLLLRKAGGDNIPARLTMSKDDDGGNGPQHPAMPETPGAPPPSPPTASRERLTKPSPGRPGDDDDTTAAEYRARDMDMMVAPW